MRKPTRVFTFLSQDYDLGRDDACIVRSDRGLEYGVCVVPAEPCPEKAKERYKMSVVRKATHADESTFRQLEIEERKARDICLYKIENRDLPMKLVDVEYTFDKHKVIFYFTAADRVDFRQLVRDLAQELRTRIELRHIQVRDEAKLTGGLGVCGRELCCATWLREFKPISMKMAKRQNLSLNPSKISGQCGRLLCCLSYENELYQKKKRKSAAEEEAAKRMAELDASEGAVGEVAEDDAAGEGAAEVDEFAGTQAVPHAEGSGVTRESAPAGPPGRETPRSGPRPQSREERPARPGAKTQADSAEQGTKPRRRRRRRRKKRQRSDRQADASRGGGGQSKPGGTGSTGKGE